MLDMGHQLQADQSELVRHDARHEAAVVRRISSARTTARSPACARAGSACRASTPTALGELKTTFEFDMFGTGVDEGQTTFRLRHAYGRAGQVRRGPDLEPVHGHGRVPELARVLGPDGHGVLPQRPGALDADPGATRDLHAGARAPGRERRRRRARRPHRTAEHQGPQFPMPDFTGALPLWRARAATSRSPGCSAGSSWDDTARRSSSTCPATRRGWGINLSSNVKLGRDTILRLQCVYGEGIQNYMNDAPVDVGIVTQSRECRDADRGQALPITGTVLFLDHNWNEQVVDRGRLFADGHRQHRRPGDRRLQDRPVRAGQSAVHPGPERDDGRRAAVGHARELLGRLRRRRRQGPVLVQIQLLGTR